MARLKAGLLVALLLFVIAVPVSTSATYNSGGIEASEAQVTMIPSTGLTEGQSVEFYLTLTNTLQSDAINVGYKFYKNQYSNNNKFVEDVIDINASSSETVTALWEGLQITDSKIWISFEYPRNSGNEQSFFIDFTVAGLPNLKVIETYLTPDSDIHAGDNLMLSTKIRNTGSEPATESVLHLDMPADIGEIYLPTQALNPGEETWLNTTFTAPSTGNYTIYVTPDYNDTVVEASEIGKSKSVELSVVPRMDLFHVGGISVSPSSGSVSGPWTVSGMIGRSDATGTTDVTMWLEISHDSSVTAIQPFSVIVVGQENAQQGWSSDFDLSSIGNLAAGSYQVTAVIDPFSDGAFIQENTDNDRASTVFYVLDNPDVVVDPGATAVPSVVKAGETVTFGVTVANSGGIEVTGVLEYDFGAQTGTSSPIILPPGESEYWTVDLIAGTGSPVAVFNAKWVSSSGSDQDTTNNNATNQITIQSNLLLNWVGSSLRILDSNGDDAPTPLEEGEQYTFAINLTTNEVGTVSFECKDSTTNPPIETYEFNITTSPSKISLSCDFTSTAPFTTIQLIPSDGSTSYVRKLTVISSSTEDNVGEKSPVGTATLIGIAALILIAVLALAIWLTRDSEEEVERDIFEYCPACDGELEGDENRCPHCSFNLAKARKQFHSCHECGESVPDLMDNCPYCGAQQDVSSFFEKRERRVKKTEKVEVALPEEEDENEIVSGYENFADTVKEFGYDEGQLEDEWDEKIASAEAEIAEIEQLYEEETPTEDMTPEEIEALESKVTTKLQSMKELSETSQNIDDLLASKGELISVKDDDSELSASDAEIRGKLYQLTGEEGVMPGDEVHIGMGLSDSSLAGNEIEETSSDFTFEDDDEPLIVQDEDDQLQPARQKPKRRQSQKKTAECGACGAQIPVLAKECSVCGAEFE